MSEHPRTREASITARPDGLYDVLRCHGETGERLTGLTLSGVFDALRSAWEPSYSGLILEAENGRRRLFINVDEADWALFLEWRKDRRERASESSGGGEK